MINMFDFTEYVFIMTLLISRKAEAKCQPLLLAFMMSDMRVKMASKVLLPRRNPNCSMPMSPLSSDTLVMYLHMRTVRMRRRLLGMVIGRY